MPLSPPKASAFPSVPPELVAELMRCYPDQCPDPGECMDDIMFRSGQVSLVRLLKRHLDQQMKQKGMT